MLAKSNRLTSAEVSEVLSKGRSLFVPASKSQKSLISAKFLAGSGHFKVAAIAPKSVAKGAVERNRLRRAVYRAVASLELPKKPGTTVVFVRNIPKGPLSPAFAEELQALFAKL